jgi:hypothetical protein
LLLDLRLMLATLTKTVGASPGLIRRAFLLPNRDKVEEVFCRNLTAEDQNPPLRELQPA